MELRVSILVAYALPAIGLAALYLPLYSYVSPFYVAERGVDLAALGAVWIAIRLFDAISDPAMGWISDRTPVTWGRRRLWLGASVPLICLGTWQVFVPPELAFGARGNPPVGPNEALIFDLKLVEIVQ